MRCQNVVHAVRQRVAGRYIQAIRLCVVALRKMKSWCCKAFPVGCTAACFPGARIPCFGKRVHVLKGMRQLFFVD